MSEQQRKAITGLTLLLVTGGALALAWLMVDVLRGQVRGDHGAGRVFMLAIANWKGLAIMLKGLPLLLSVGLALLGRYRLRDWLFFSIVGVCVVGAASAIGLYLEVSSVDGARNFWPYSPLEQLQDYGSFLSAAQSTLGWAGAWFISVLLSELGIKKWTGA